MANKGHEEFSYTREQGKDIIVDGSLLDDITFSEPDMEKAYSELTKLTKKDIGLEWKIVNLSDYWRKKLIPRGLRIKTMPPFSTEDTEFRSKWEAILNKCSLDLILLTIEHDKKEKEEVEAKLSEIQSQISKMPDEQKKDPFQSKHAQDIESHTNKVKKEKIQAFKRNQTDYEEGKVYNWNKPTQRKTQRQGSAPS